MWFGHVTSNWAVTFDNQSGKIDDSTDALQCETRIKEKASKDINH